MVRHKCISLQEQHTHKNPIVYRLHFHFWKRILLDFHIWIMYLSEKKESNHRAVFFIRGCIHSNRINGRHRWISFDCLFFRSFFLFLSPIFLAFFFYFLLAFASKQLLPYTIMVIQFQWCSLPFYPQNRSNSMNV